ncbi:MAG: DNA mismatch repair protein MutS, partial [Pseudomonadota bacterium]
MQAKSANPGGMEEAAQSATEASDGKRRAGRNTAPSPGVTPSMQQYLEIKTANPDSLLWYRMGDFYELFFEDAVVAADALSITLTKRGKHLGEDIPMCGVPVVRADEYLQRLIRQGFRVAVCEQLEDPADARKRGSKAVVHRDVVRLVTPGTLTEDTLLEPNQRNYLTAVLPRLDTDGGVTDLAIAAFDLSTGEFEVGTVADGDAPGELARLLPRELLVPDTIGIPPPLKETFEFVGAAVTPVPRASFDSTNGAFMLSEALGVSDLTAFGEFSRPETAAIGALLRYVSLTQVGKRPVVRPPNRIGAGSTLVIDAATRASLELVRTAAGDRKGSLLAAMDRTVTGPGARELSARLASPLTDTAEINARLDAVGMLVGQDILRTDLRRTLRQCPDIARAISRLSLQRGGPRDLGALRDGLAVARDVANLMGTGATDTLPRDVARALEAISDPAPDLFAAFKSALADELPMLKRDGGYIRAGFSEDL